MSFANQQAHTGGTIDILDNFASISGLASAKDMLLKTLMFYVDFNEMVTSDLVLLSRKDQKADSDGNLIALSEGMKVSVYTDDKDNQGRTDNLIAYGTVVRNKDTIGWSKSVRWLCRIAPPGIRHESEIIP